LNDGQNPKLPRRPRVHVCEYGQQSCRGRSAGVAKRPRELLSPEIPNVPCGRAQHPAARIYKPPPSLRRVGAIRNLGIAVDRFNAPVWGHPACLPARFRVLLRGRTWLASDSALSNCFTVWGHPASLPAPPWPHLSRIRQRLVELLQLRGARGAVGEELAVAGPQFNRLAVQRRRTEEVALLERQVRPQLHTPPHTRPGSPQRRLQGGGRGVSSLTGHSPWDPSVEPVDAVPPSTPPCSRRSSARA
jgi:hypothetical protein